MSIGRYFSLSLPLSLSLFLSLSIVAFFISVFLYFLLSLFLYFSLYSFRSLCFDLCMWFVLYVVSYCFLALG